MSFCWMFPCPRAPFAARRWTGSALPNCLKADPKSSSIPIILVTAHAMRGDREAFLAQSGADGYIAKPVVDHEEMVNQVRQVLSRGPGQG
jgi:two-component system cell cycle response regulator DivK